MALWSDTAGPASRLLTNIPGFWRRAAPPGTGREALRAFRGALHTPPRGRRHKVRQTGGLNNRNVFSQFWRLGSPKSRCRRGWFLLRAVRVLFQPSLLCRGWLSSPCLLSLHHSVSKFPLLMRTPDVLDEDPPQ